MCCDLPRRGMRGLRLVRPLQGCAGPGHSSVSVLAWCSVLPVHHGVRGFRHDYMSGLFYLLGKRPIRSDGNWRISPPGAGLQVLLNGHGLTPGREVHQWVASRMHPPAQTVLARCPGDTGSNSAPIGGSVRMRYFGTFMPDVVARP
jgi:hypothetical protein